MNTIKIIAVILGLPFIIGTSCVNSVYVEVDFELNHCPPIQSDLPTTFHRVESILEPNSFYPSCRKFSGYIYRKFNDKSQITDSIDGYVKLARTNTCSIRILTRINCGEKDKVKVLGFTKVVPIGNTKKAKQWCSDRDLSPFQIRLIDWPRSVLMCDFPNTLSRFYNTSETIL